MNLRLFPARGMHAVHMLVVPEYFSASEQLFPLWPEWHSERALALFTATATLLFLPNSIGCIADLVQGRT